MTKQDAILSFGSDVPAKEVVKALAKRRIATTVGAVHTARSTARRKASLQTAAVQAAASIVENGNGRPSESVFAFRKLVIKLGVDTATVEVNRIREGLANLIEHN